MGAFKLLAVDLAKITKKKGVLLSVIAALLVPIVYAAILLSATWSPYDNLSNLPVAVVNKDKGAMSGDETINVGKDLVEDMKKSMTLGFQFVSEERAKKGLENQDYYMMIEIPENFSANITTVLSENPKVPELRYIQNEGLNFMAAQVTNSATEKIREQLGNKITETYAKNLFAQLGEIANGFQSAADGSEQINSGASQLHDGTTTMLQSLQEKAPDIDKLAAGSQELEAGTKQLLGSLTAKQGDIAKLASGTQQLETGVGQLLAAIMDGAPKVNLLNTELKGLAEKAPTLKVGTSQVLQGLQGINGKLPDLKAGSSAVAGYMNSVTTGLDGLFKTNTDLELKLEGLSKKYPSLQTDMDFLTIVGTVEGITTNLGKLSTPAPLVNGAAQSLALGISNPNDKQALTLEVLVPMLVAGQTQIDEGATELLEGSKLLSAGSTELNTNWKTMITKVTEMHEGSKLISAGNAEVNKGWKQLSVGASQLHSGMQQVSNGTQSVQTGWGDLTDGVTLLDGGIGQIEDGSNELATGLGDGAEKAGAIHAGDANIAMLSSPVKVAGEKVNGYQYYRDSTAPYILSLALFVGMLILSFVVDFKKPADLSVSKGSWFASKLMKLSIFAVAQAILVSSFALIFLKLQVGSALLFIMFAIFVSLTFMTIIFFLVAFAGNLGRFAALVFIVLQLSITGANLPIEMLPENLRALSQYLPLTYSNAGFKAIISLDDSGFMWANLGVLFIYLAIFAALALSVFLFSGKKQIEETSFSA